MSADLRARLAQALCLAFEHAASSVSTGSETITYGNMADVAAAEVQAELDAKDAEIGRLRRELAAANRRYEERTPTQWAYEQACHALEKHRERADVAEAARLMQVAAAERWEAEAEQAEAELEQWRACFGETALKDARGVLAERDRLREELRLARFDKERAEATVARLKLLRDDYWRLPGCSEIGDDLDAALDQAPAAEQDEGEGK